ncbi:MAG: TetR/AcrR family transcriptional regulator [Treponema sp.]|nr:TetR/AcrR family transcriptional regulator [Treponema sp.]
MQAAEKRRLEQEMLKAERIRHIIECSFGLFADKGIETISMNEIATQAEIGVASLYRYFSTKEDLAIEAAIYAWKIEEDLFNKAFSFEGYDDLNGYDQLSSMLDIFTDALATQSSFFRFVNYFDAFIKREKVSPGRLTKYEEAITGLKDIVVGAIKKGRKDGSISFGGKKDSELAKASDDEIYFTVMHSLFSLAQKLSLSGEMLNMNMEVRPEKQMNLAISFFLEALK